jgi:hypothetical protein
MVEDDQEGDDTDYEAEEVGVVTASKQAGSDVKAGAHGAEGGTNGQRDMGKGERGVG